MDDKISVIVPVYNVELYLERCLDSIIHNTYKNLEIICVDDGSTDGCGGILDRYAQMDKRVVVIHRENGGVSAARNSGMDAATGDSVSFIDSDDWIHPQYFEILLEYQKKEEFDFSMCSFVSTTDYLESEWIDKTTLEIQKMTLTDVFVDTMPEATFGESCIERLWCRNIVLLKRSELQRMLHLTALPSGNVMISARAL